MQRTCIYLTDPQMKYFKKVSLRMDIAFAEAVRRALDESMLRDDAKLMRELEESRLRAHSEEDENTDT